MLAAQFTAPGQPLRLGRVDRPEAGPGEVLVRVRAVAICASDLHILSGMTDTAGTPRILGHEIAGEVAALGDGVGELEVGQRVFVNAILGCLECDFCHRGEANNCPNRRIIGIHVDGAMAEYLVVPSRNCIVLPATVPFTEIAMIDSAGPPLNAIEQLRLEPGARLGVMGVGALGLHVVRLATVQGVEVLAVDTSEVARGRALEAGAVAAYAPSPDLAERILAEHGPLAAVIDTAAVQSTVDLGFSVLEPSGTHLIVGLNPDGLHIDAVPFVRRALRLSSAYGYRHDHARRVAQLLSDGAFSLEGAVSAVYPLTEVNEAMEAFRARRGAPVRVVLEV